MRKVKIRKKTQILEELLKRETTTEVIEKWQVKWLGNLCRTNDTRISKMVILMETEGEKMERTTTNILEIERRAYIRLWEIEITIEGSQDRDRWSTISGGKGKGYVF